jgi:malonyl-CoA O-methyltransferase
VSGFDEQAYGVDPRVLRRANDKCAGSYLSEIPDLIADRLFERLALLKLQPQRILDVGAGNARHAARLKALYPKAMVVNVDISLAMLQQAERGRFWQRKPVRVCADASVALPFADGSFDLVFSNLMVPWVHPPDIFAGEVNRLLAADAAFFVSSVGPDTLIELREAWAAVDTATHINAMLDMHDLGDVFLRASIADPVMDAERLHLHYSSVETLLQELVGLGATNTLTGRRRGLTAAGVRQRLAAVYPLNEQGGVTATLEVVYAHGWKGQPKAGKNTPDEFFISIDSLKTPAKRGES